MAKKKFGNLALDNSLSSFVRNDTEDEEKGYNPLKDKRKPKATKVKNEKVLEKEVVKPKETPIPVKVQTEIPTTPETKPKVKNAIPVLKDLPEDFKAHSALFSSDQLDKLRDLVNYKKWKVDKKFTIQLAIFEAIECLFKDRIPLTEFPKDFITYAPAFSKKQWKKLDEDFVPEIKFKQKGKYSLKHAIFEAIQMYMDNNPINPNNSTYGR